MMPHDLLASNILYDVNITVFENVYLVFSLSLSLSPISLFSLYTSISSTLYLPLSPLSSLQYIYIYIHLYLSTLSVSVSASVSIPISIYISISIPSLYPYRYLSLSLSDIHLYQLAICYLRIKKIMVDISELPVAIYRIPSHSVCWLVACCRDIMKAPACPAIIYGRRWVG